MWREKIIPRSPHRQRIKGKPSTGATSPESRLALKNQAQECRVSKDMHFCRRARCKLRGLSGPGSALICQRGDC